ncbi:ribosomal protein S18 acetylase RimI-like enzyme [Nocardia tenerifensis]|uniref:Ribosomal protein S18 acetylase RimI-like enzyme n=1 Tax=Nocardia tenerifensis TaxID=228006 RepID=A0A318KES9_9NOCA|nr:GNAT family N-acetyltransferase [Nocardia tenerifensis]PXX70772.1 ribosomal protein S18 acetylase RimI-like enzyme [Nocardia tenerifensis]
MITVRPRTLEDLPACVAALRQVHAVDGYPVVWPQDPARWLTPAKLVDARVAEVGGVVVGQVGIGASALPRPVRDAVPETALMSVIRLFVTPADRGCGVGRRLLDAAVEMVEQRGCRAVLDVESRAVAAISLYERAGWKRMHSTRAQWSRSDGQAALLHYYLGP